jgi:hypothetical protein
MQHLRWISPELAAPLVAAVCACAAPAHGGEVCGDATGTAPVPGRPADGRPRDTDFLSSDLLPPERFAPADGAEPGVVSLNEDVLRLGGEASRAAVASRTPGLRIRSVLCIRHRPEMLGLLLENASPGPLGGRARVEVTMAGVTAVLFTRLPGLAAGEARHVLLSSSTPLAGAATVSLQLQPEGGRPPRPR